MLAALLALLLALLLLPAHALLPPRVSVHSDISTAVVQDMIQQANLAIASRNAFHCAVPGGSVLKMLAGLTTTQTSTDFSKWHLFYVNHKCVPRDDPSATHVKAQKLFLHALPALHAYPIAEDQENAATQYANTIQQIVPTHNNLPQFDYMLLGMGKDGHIGSLYPGRPEVLQTTPTVLRVDKKDPASITLSLPVMNAAREIRVLLEGEDKAEAVRDGVTRARPAADFPGCGVAPHTRWMVDTAAARLLDKSLYTT